MSDVPINAYLISTTREDDASYMALGDLAAVLSRHPGTKIIGGHMVSLLAAAFPSPGLIERRTGDADAGIPVQLADAGQIHVDLLNAGYEAESGNRYVKTGYDHPKPTIDLLIPAFSGRFGDEVRGDRGFDTMPGLVLALARGLNITAHVTYRDGATGMIETQVPTVESAVVLKAYAYTNRLAVKDLVDLSNLLHILDEHGADKLGGWRLNEPDLRGARSDAAKNLHLLAARLDSGRHDQVRGLDPRKIAVLIRRHVAGSSGREPRR